MKEQLEKEEIQWKGQKASDQKEAVVQAEDIAKIVSRWSGVPITSLTVSETRKLLELENELHQRVVAQDIAVDAVAQSVRTSRAGLTDPSRPLASFLFLGPTGVGKTELAKTLATALYGDEKAMIRIDMSEYMERHSVAKLIGAPPGYIGYDEGGQLTEAVRRRPYSIVLLDEIEKAHPDIFHSLLQVLDDGRLTDSKGKTVSFRNVILIMTSNIASDLIRQRAINGIESFNKDFEEMKQEIFTRIADYMKPEFINRIDDMIVFHPLGKEHIREILKIQTSDLNERLKEKEIAMKLTDAAVNKVCEIGYDPSLGARPLKRAVEKHIRNPLANELLQGKIQEGGEILCDFRNDSFVFDKVSEKCC